MSLCKQIVKQLDYEGYLGSLMYPPRQRPAIWALRALNAECAMDIKRIEFYKLDLKLKQTPITQELPNLNEYWLSRLMNAKTVTKYNTLNDLEEYCEASFSSLLYLSLEILGIKDIKADHAISHVGKCTGLINTIRGISHFAKKRQCYLPNDLLGKYSISNEQIFRGDMSNMANLVHDIASRAFQHKETALDHFKHLPKNALPVMLHIVPCIYYLELFETCQFDISNQEIYRKNAFLLFQLLKYKMLGFR